MTLFDTTFAALVMIAQKSGKIVNGTYIELVTYTGELVRIAVWLADPSVMSVRVPACQ